MAPVRIAVIGAGLIGRTHIAVLRSGNPDYTLAAVADPSPVAAQEGKTLGYPVYAAIEEMLDTAKPDGAIVAVPNQTAREGRPRLHRAQDSDHRRKADRGLGRRSA